MALCPVEAQGRSPVMHHEGHIPAQVQRIKPGIEITRVIDEAIGVIGRLPRATHAHQVRSQATASPLKVRNNIAPQVGRRGVTVQEDNWITCPGIDISHVCIEDRHSSPFIGVSSRDRACAHGYCSSNSCFYDENEGISYLSKVGEPFLTPRPSRQGLGSLPNGCTSPSMVLV